MNKKLLFQAAFWTMKTVQYHSDEKRIGEGKEICCNYEKN